MSVATGMIATQAAKNIHVCADGVTCSSATAMGTKTRSQFTFTESFRLLIVGIFEDWNNAF
jgi:hypothetical protein